MSEKNLGGAPLGNKNAKKLTDSELKQVAYQQYCDHLAKGKSKKSWYFEHPDLTMTWETFEVYLQDEVEFPPLKRKVSECKGFAIWEQHCEDAANGRNQHANTASLQMVMRNKYGWDKEAKGTVTDTGEYDKSMKKLVAQLKEIQSERKMANKTESNAE